MHTYVFDKVEDPNRLRLAFITIEQLIEDIGIESTINQYLSWVVDRSMFIEAINHTTKAIQLRYGSEVDYLEAVSKAVSLFKHLNRVITIGEADAKLLLETRVVNVEFSGETIAITTRLSEEEYLRGLEQDRPLGKE